ncbi:MAG: ribonuclease III [Opitutales bacterium]
MEEKHTISGYQFNDPALETLAYTHPSCNAARGDNQRLEFLGDAVLDLIVAEALYHRLPEQDEGALDWARASLVNGRSLAEKARQWGLAERILISESQRMHHPEPSNRMLEDCLEALIGAIYLDGGLDAARKCVLHMFREKLDAVRAGSATRNPKSLLQEWTQKYHGGALPNYELMQSEGPDHRKRYRVKAVLDGVELGQGLGSSIKTAEMAASEAALQGLQSNE